MESAALRRAVRQAIVEAEQACDPLRNTLMDRTDLQRIIGRLKENLETLELAYERVLAGKEELAARLSRRHIDAGWAQPHHTASPRA